MLSDLGLRAPLRAIDVCAGSGIGSAAFEVCGFARTVCYIEREPWCQRLLIERMRTGDLLSAPIFDDLREFDGRPWRGCVDFIFGGIPCQPYSVAGKQLGATDERDLWPDLRRIIREVGPRIVLIENVPGLLSSSGGEVGDAATVPGWNFGRILRDLALDGLDAEWTVLAAADIGANHLRKRVWLVAYATTDIRRSDGRCVESRAREGGSEAQVWAVREGVWDAINGGLAAGGAPLAYPGAGQRADGWTPGDAGHADERGATVADSEGQPERSGLRAGGAGGEWRGRSGDGGSAGDVPDAGGAGLPEWYRGDVAPWTRSAIDECSRGHAQPDVGSLADGLAAQLDGPACYEWWQHEPDVPRLASGVRERVAKLKCLGNGWVPHCAAYVAGRILAGLLAAEEEMTDGT